jgi:hypothetical protein
VKSVRYRGGFLLQVDLTSLEYCMDLTTDVHAEDVVGIRGCPTYLMELENIILSEIRFRKPKTSCFFSYLEYEPNTNTSILCKTGYSKEREGG